MDDVANVSGKHGLSSHQISGSI